MKYAKAFLAFFIISLLGVEVLGAEKKKRRKYTKAYYEYEELFDVFKLQILKEGDNSTVIDYQKDGLHMHVIGWNARNMALYLNTTVDNKPFKTTLGKLSDKKEGGYHAVYLCMENILKFMKLGTRVKIFCPYEYAMRERPVASTVGPFSDIWLEFELIDVLDENEESKKPSRVTHYAKPKTFTSKDEVFEFFKVEILREGNTTVYPRLSDILHYHYIGRIAKNKQIYAQTNRKKNPIKGILGSGDSENLLLCHQIVLPYIKVGSLVKFQCPYKYAFDRIARPDVSRLIKAFTNLEFEFEIMEIEKNAKLHPNFNPNDFNDIQDFFDVRFVERGSGSNLEYGDKISYVYNLYLVKDRDDPNKDLIESNKPGEPFSAYFTPLAIVKCQEMVMPFLRVGDRFSMYCPNQFAYGDRKIGTRLLPFSNLFFEIAIVGAEKPKRDL